MTRGATELSQQVFDLHMTIFYICVAIALVVFGLMFWSIVHHRKAKGVVPAQFHGSMKIEMLWTAIPVLILVAMAVPATRTLVAMEDTSASELTVLVTGSQWKWHYKYLDYPIEFYSVLATPRAQIANEADKAPDYLMAVDKPLVLPTGKKVRFLLTADDVIHSWWVPDFAIKKDAVPGFINETWARIDKPGLYYGRCAELCGRDHGFMPVAVEVKTPEEFEAWAQQQVAQAEQAKAEAASAGPMAMDELMALGQKVYESACVACHQASGEGLAGVFPALKGSAIATGDPAAHIHIVLFGKAGTAMQAFGKQLGVKELAAVITYERNAWGNAKGDMVQPADIVAAIEKGE
ncbi:MAG: cytochrome c oxidase subunit II [Thauera sp.]|nr:cytochrome c oxidase subunit II [Thauera sp.]